MMMILMDGVLEDIEYICFKKWFNNNLSKINN